MGAKFIVYGSGAGGSGVQSVTGLNTDNTDPLNPVVQISVDGSSITGAGTLVSPLIATGSLYQTDTYANWEVKRLAGTLPAGKWVGVTTVTSQPSAVLSMFCPAVNRIGLGGIGQFLNADWQNVGVYTGVVGLTTVPFTTNIGQWYVAIESTAVDGDVVIYNCLHYQVISAVSFDGSDPATNVTAYTLLPKATANMGYIIESDQIEFDWSNNWMQYRADKRGNTYRYSKLADAGYSLGFTALDLMQWGRDTAYSINVEESRVNILNIVGTVNRLKATNGSNFNGNTVFGTLVGMTLTNSGSFADCIVQATRVLNSFNITSGAVTNKTFNASCTGWSITAESLLFTETISSSTNYINVENGFSNYTQSIDITGLTTLDLSVCESAGIYILTGASATLATITNFPATFRFNLKPAATIVATITFTTVALLANNKIAGPTANVVLNGTNGDQITLEATTIGGFAVTEQLDANTNL